MIDKEYLESKLAIFIENNRKLQEEISKNISLSKKYEGAIEAIQVLLDDLKAKENAN